MFYFILDAKIRPDVDERLLHLRPEALDDIRMEDLIKEYLTSKNNVSFYILVSKSKTKMVMQ